MSSPVYGAENAEVVVARSREEIEKIRPAWEKMQRHPNADIDYYLTVVDSRRKILRPHVLVMEVNEEPVALMVGRVEDIHMEMKMGYIPLFRPGMRAITIVYGGIMGAADLNGNCRLFMAALMDSLRSGEADVVYFSHLDAASNVCKNAKTMPAFMCRPFYSIPSLHWKMPVPENMNEFYDSLEYKVRKNLRRSARNMAKAYPDRITIQSFRNQGDVETFLRDAEEIAKKTYQRGLGVGFVCDEETRRLVSLTAVKQCLRSYIMYIDGTPAAFERAVRYGDTLFCENAGYDPSFKKTDPGTNLFLKVIEDACAEGGIRFIDFGFGDADYKRHYCTQHVQEESLHIFAPTVKGAAINAVRTVFLVASKCAETIIRKLNLYERMKRSWRSNLARNANEGGVSEPH